MEGEQQKYKNILIIVGGLLVFSFILHLKALIYAALIISILSALVPQIATAVDWLWMKLAMALGWVNTRILLSIVFYLFLFPIAALSRLFSNDPLQIKRKKSSLYTERNHEYSSKDLENIW